MLRALSAGNSCFTADEPSSKLVDGVELGLEPPKLSCLALRFTESREIDNKRGCC